MTSPDYDYGKLQGQIDMLRQRVEILEAARDEPIQKVDVRTCEKHTVVEDNCGCAICSVCGISMDGWYCPLSDSHVCEYDDDDECCRYCGKPEERK